MSAISDSAKKLLSDGEQYARRHGRFHAMLEDYLISAIEPGSDSGHILQQLKFDTSALHAHLIALEATYQFGGTVKESLLAKAADEAERMSSPFILPGHLLLAILSSKSSALDRYLDALGCTKEYLAEKCRYILRSHCQAALLPGSQLSHACPVCSHVNEICNRTAIIAVSYCH